ncbi:CPBP family intramembrane metalloprotease [Staphylococcus hominis]|uniref:CPBP family glutamic-type intramembrane protease n=1 Tax=Staphylococcus hominis TaxID=1290 RepID=UPI001F3400D2|nr:CPBP family glutamic-type intramembrane protease [Staphylococcus hominis]UJB23599.1 CPBP family intramembrane metalloprotease [Staphylococcus hominis]
MKNTSKPLIWFVASFIVFHLILFIMWGEHQEYWYLYTGIMLIAGISYVFYQRDITSKRLLTSIGVGVITGIVLVIIQLIFSLISSQITYTELIKELSRTGVYFKWQMLVTILFVIPCHELYMRAVLQKELNKFRLPRWLTILIPALCSSSLFIYLDKWWIVIFIFIAQVILSLSYQYTRRIVTSSLGQIVAIILLLIFHG